MDTSSREIRKNKKGIERSAQQEVDEGEFQERAEVGLNFDIRPNKRITHVQLSKQAGREPNIEGPTNWVRDESTQRKRKSLDQKERQRFESSYEAHTPRRTEYEDLIHNNQTNGKEESKEERNKQEYKAESGDMYYVELASDGEEEGEKIVENNRGSSGWKIELANYMQQSLKLKRKREDRRILQITRVAWEDENGKDQVGLHPKPRGQLEEFRKFLNVMVLDLKGNKFTWFSNPRNGFITKERIDRVLVNWQWRKKFQHAVLEVLPAISSDHCPLMLTTSPRNKTNTHFKYEAFRKDHEECCNVINKGWNKEIIRGTAWTNIIQRMKNCKEELRKWSRTTFKRIDGDYTVKTGYYAATEEKRKEKGEKASTSTDLKDLWKEIWRMQDTGFTWTPREGNRLAHEIADRISMESLENQWRRACATTLPNQRSRSQVEDSPIIGDIHEGGKTNHALLAEKDSFRHLWVLGIEFAAVHLARALLVIWSW
ncbi:hypothetical protein Ahy_B01g053905 [Arachis hypogaea]|uniref:RNase H type-1 domain-containing protein n=1 Tax=Arachis hypogaea TaxID=3818 RepID=A0A445ASU6_ARAHY|nr:hypothetical protein Ahy_B01g053905 [Arachis hypogaea]